MAPLLRKFIADTEDLWFLGSIVVVAANAGGAWSPVGDVTTIMLWIGGQVTAVNFVLPLLVPSLICLFVPLTVLSFIKPGVVHALTDTDERQLGIAAPLFVPAFNNLTHLNHFMGKLLCLEILCVMPELLHRHKPEMERHTLSVANVIRRVDPPSILFFLGTLLAVASLQTTGLLSRFATLLDEKYGNIYLINIVIGLVSAIVDNVPPVTGAMGMYTLDTFRAESDFWQLRAYCAGTRNSALINVSPAGVAMIGILKNNFVWSLKHITWLALLGYFSGVAVYYLMYGI